MMEIQTVNLLIQPNSETLEISVNFRHQGLKYEILSIEHHYRDITIYLNRDVIIEIESLVEEWIENNTMDYDDFEY